MNNSNPENNKQPIPRSRKVLFYGLMVLFIGFVSLILAEITTRFFFPTKLGTNQSSIFQLDPWLGWSIEPNHISSFIGADGQYSWKRSNHIGTLGPEFHIPKRRGTMRVLVVGDSHIHSTLSEPKTMTAQIRSILGKKYPYVDIINAAVGAYSPYQQLLRILTLVQTVDPDVIIWCLYSGNDISDLELSNGPVIDDFCQSKIVEMDPNYHITYEQPPDNHFRSPVWKILTDNFRIFDLIDYWQFNFHLDSNWKKNAELRLYGGIKIGPLSNLSIDQIRELIPDQKTHMAWNAWLSQGGLQTIYFKIHPERVDISRGKLLAIISAFSVLQSRQSIAVFMLHIPTFLKSPLAQKEPFSNFTKQSIVKDTSLDDQLKQLAQSWSAQAGIRFFDGFNILQNALPDGGWFETTDGHITAKAQKAFAEKLVPAINTVNINEKQTYPLPDKLLKNMIKNQQRFAFDPWPIVARWDQATQIHDGPLTVQLHSIMAIPTPGPWKVGSIWNFSEYPTDTIFQVYWKIDHADKPVDKVFRSVFLTNPDKQHPKKMTIKGWAHQGMYWQNPFPDLPDAISLENASGQRISPVYRIPWQ